MQFDEYRDRWSFADLSRTDDRVLVVRLHTEGGPLVWDAHVHRELPDLLHAIATDRQTRVVVLTGAGDRFLHYPEENSRAMTSGDVPVHGLDRVFSEAKRIIDELLDIEVPVIAAVNGPVHAHAELVLLSDIVVISDHTTFADSPHFPAGLVPGDGIQIVLSALLGPNRARYFMLTGDEISAAQALDWGLVGEVCAAADVLPQALAHAHRLASMNPLVLRYTRQVFMQPFKLASAQLLAHGMALETIAHASAAQWASAATSAIDRGQPTQVGSDDVGDEGRPA